ncbi:MAG TPA: hypothetical protein VH480_14325, partial [Streptosporangiaceae bacterium]
MRMQLGRMRLGRISAALVLAMTGVVLVGGAAVAVTVTRASGGTTVADSPGIPNPYIFVHDPSLARDA